MDQLIIAGKAYSSRLLVGTGKYRDFAQTGEAIEASGAQIVTVAIRRTNIGQNPGEPNLLDTGCSAYAAPRARTARRP
jgi:thiazole synthase